MTKKITFFCTFVSMFLNSCAQRNFANQDSKQQSDVGETAQNQTEINSNSRYFLKVSPIGETQDKTKIRGDFKFELCKNDSDLRYCGDVFLATFHYDGKTISLKKRLKNSDSSTAHALAKTPKNTQFTKNKAPIAAASACTFIAAAVVAICYSKGIPTTWIPHLAEAIGGLSLFAGSGKVIYDKAQDHYKNKKDAQLANLLHGNPDTLEHITTLVQGRSPQQTLQVNFFWHLARLRDDLGVQFHPDALLLFDEFEQFLSHLKREQADIIKSITFLKVKTGNYYVSPKDNTSEESSEFEVMVNEPYWMQQTEVTQELFFKVMHYNPAHFTKEEHCASTKSPQTNYWVTGTYEGIPIVDLQGNPTQMCLKNPVENLSIFEAKRFVKIINSWDLGVFGLPTFIHWEIVARVGNDDFPGDGNATSLREHEWSTLNSHGHPHPVGDLLPNKWMFYDVMGNVREYTDHKYDEGIYKNFKVREFLPKGGGWTESKPVNIDLKSALSKLTQYQDITPLDPLLINGGSCLSTNPKGFMMAPEKNYYKQIAASRYVDTGFRLIREN